MQECVYECVEMRVWTAASCCKNGWSSLEGLTLAAALLRISRCFKIKQSELECETKELLYEIYSVKQTLYS